MHHECSDGAGAFSGKPALCENLHAVMGILAGIRILAHFVDFSGSGETAHWSAMLLLNVVDKKSVVEEKVLVVTSLMLQVLCIH